MTSAYGINMANELPVKTSQLKVPDPGTIREMIHIYLEAYKNDTTIQLKYIVPQLIEHMSETLTLRVRQRECEFIIARSETSDQIMGWLLLIFKLEKDKQISEEHVLLTQYALLPDVIAKGKKEGIGMDKLKDLAHTLLNEFKRAREIHLPDKHCIISTLVVDPKYQNQGVASALLVKAISLSEVFLFPIWVQAPESCQNLFARHFFKEVGEYTLDLNKHVPKTDDKGKKKAVSILGKYVWEFMVRKEPLEPAISAYQASKVFEEQEQERRIGGTFLELFPKKGKSAKRMFNAFAKETAEPEETDMLLGRDVQTASGTDLIARSDAGEVSSMPLHRKAGSHDEQEAKMKDKENR